MKGSLIAVIVAVALAAGLVIVPLQNSIAQQPLADAPAPQLAQNIPDGPTPQPAQSLGHGVTPGSGTSNAPAASTTPTNSLQLNSSPTTVIASPQDQTGLTPTGPADKVSDHVALPDDQKEAPAFHANMIVPGVNVNYVQVPVTVKDHHKNLVPGLDWRDFRVYENDQRMSIKYFSTDPVPLSVAFVIDQSVASQTMSKVNQSLAAVSGAFANYDEVGVYTYNTHPKMQTIFTGSQSARLTAAIEKSKAEGRDTMIGPGSGPMGQGVYINDTSWQTMPDVSGGGPTAGGKFNVTPKQAHPLNDAILMAAQDLARRDSTRRRVIYVLSDGREYGSKAKYKDVVKYLQEHKIAVYGTLVGDSATWGLGFFDRVHLPLMLADNILPQYAVATGGQFVSEFSVDGIQHSFAAIAEQVRTQYTIGYYSTESIYDEKYRRIEVQVARPGFSVIAKQGYFPSAQDK